MTTRTLAATFLTATLAALAGCDQRPAAPVSRAAAPAAALPADLFLTSAPADAKAVEEAKKQAKPGERIALRGRIGGSDDPFVENRAVFTVMGPGVPACSDNPDDKCKTPWDYCCETPETIAEHQATIQVVDAGGQPLKLSLKGRNDLRELSDCVVVGTVAQADGQVLVVNATGIYVARK